jgi:DNA-binding protein YbaB
MFEERQVDEWQEGFERRAARAREMAARMAGLQASARSSDGLIEVTVGRSGELTDLTLSEQTRHRSAASLARAILATVADARAELADKATTVVSETIGADSEAGRAVLDSYR